MITMSAGDLLLVGIGALAGGDHRPPRLAAAEEAGAMKRGHKRRVDYGQTAIGQLNLALDDSERFAAQNRERLKKFGGILRCSKCHYEIALGDVDEYCKTGWPKHCGETMTWFTNKELQNPQQMKPHPKGWRYR